MLTRALRIMSALLFIAALPMFAGCAPCRTSRATYTTTTGYTPNTTMHTALGMPPNAAEGECYGRVFIPPQFKTVSDRVCVREAMEKVEIVPAQYEWVEERVCVKDASTELREIAPATYETQERKVEIEGNRRGWEWVESGRCATQDGKPVRDVFCLVKHPATYRTVSSKCMVKPAKFEQVTIPAEYQTVRRQKLICPATTRKTTIPAEFENVEKRVQVAEGRVEWQRVVCEAKTASNTVNEVKTALLVAGYRPGPLNGEMTEQDRAALRAYQKENGLGVGELNYETLNKLGVRVD